MSRNREGLTAPYACAPKHTLIFSGSSQDAGLKHSGKTAGQPGQQRRPGSSLAVDDKAAASSWEGRMRGAGHSFRRPGRGEACITGCADVVSGRPSSLRTRRRSVPLRRLCVELRRRSVPGSWPSSHVLDVRRILRPPWALGQGARNPSALHVAGGPCGSGLVRRLDSFTQACGPWISESCA